jgi:lipopolysaccharide export system protein LptA
MLLMLLGVLAVTGAAGAQAPGSSSPVEISSDRGEFLREEGRGVFTGNVVANQAGGRITTDKLTLSCYRVAPQRRPSRANRNAWSPKATFFIRRPTRRFGAITPPTIRSAIPSL